MIVAECNEAPCANWSAWKANTCSRSCGSGILSKERKCENDGVFTRQGDSNCVGKGLTQLNLFVAVELDQIVFLRNILSKICQI